MRATLVQVNLVSNRLSAHVAGGEGLCTHRAGSVTAHEGHRAPSLHADTTAVRLFYVSNLTFKVA